jgi:hypothetical protein
MKFHTPEYVKYLEELPLKHTRSSDTKSTSSSCKIAGMPGVM